jgi:hypothetical protein
VPDVSDVPGDAAGLRAANARLRELLAERDAGIVLNAARRGKLQRKRRALVARMLTRRDDYLRFAHDLRVPFDNNEAGLGRASRSYRGVGEVLAVHVRNGGRAQECPGL